jgi:hypothetical protein
VTHQADRKFEGVMAQDERRSAFALPRLVCAWQLDPKAKRLSCTWAAPADAARWRHAVPA